MTRTRLATVLTLSLVLLSSYSLRADVRSDQKARVQFAGMLGRMFNMFGGKSAREGVTTSIALKGDRKATTIDTTEQIVDLAEEKVYDIDLKKKSYTVTTFAELRRRMEEARKKAEEDARKEAGKEKREGKTAGGRPEREAGRDRLRPQEHRRQENDQRLRHASGGDDGDGPREGQDPRAGRRHGADLGHVARAEDAGDEGDRRLRRALREAAVRHDDRRRLAPSRWRRRWRCTR